MPTEKREGYIQALESQAKRALVDSAIKNRHIFPLSFLLAEAVTAYCKDDTKTKVRESMTRSDFSRESRDVAEISIANSLSIYKIINPLTTLKMVLDVSMAGISMAVDRSVDFITGRSELLKDSHPVAAGIKFGFNAIVSIPTLVLIAVVNVDKLLPARSEPEPVAKKDDERQDKDSSFSNPLLDSGSTKSKSQTHSVSNNPAIAARVGPVANTSTVSILATVSQNQTTGVLKAKKSEPIVMPDSTALHDAVKSLANNFETLVKALPSYNEDLSTEKQHRERPQQSLSAEDVVGKLTIFIDHIMKSTENIPDIIKAIHEKLNQSGITAEDKWNASIKILAEIATPLNDGDTASTNKIKSLRMYEKAAINPIAAVKEMVVVLGKSLDTQTKINDTKSTVSIKPEHTPPTPRGGPASAA
jgi:hypothetical protein